MGETAPYDPGTIELAALAKTLGDEDGAVAYVCALLRRAGTGLDVAHLWGLVGLTPPQWAEQQWRYTDVALVACAVPGASLAVVCSENDANRLTFGGLEVQVPPAHGPASWRREPSFARLDRIPLPHPNELHHRRRAARHILPIRPHARGHRLSFLFRI
jgi:hypothetical protein